MPCGFSALWFNPPFAARRAPLKTRRVGATSALLLATALTFTGHGLYAMGYYDVPLNFRMMTSEILPLTEPPVLFLLKIAGWLDFVVVAMVLIPVIPNKRFFAWSTRSLSSALSPGPQSFSGKSTDGWLSDRHHLLIPFAPNAAWVNLHGSLGRCDHYREGVSLLRTDSPLERPRPLARRSPRPHPSLARSSLVDHHITEEKTRGSDGDRWRSGRQYRVRKDSSRVGLIETNRLWFRQTDLTRRWPTDVRGRFLWSRPHRGC